MLDGITINPFTVDMMAMPIMSGSLAIYFWLARPRSRTTWILAAFFTFGALFGLTGALSAGARGFLVQHAQFLFLLPTAWFLAWFAYALEGNAQPREARWVLGITGGVGVVLIAQVFYNLATHVFWYGIDDVPYQVLGWLLIAYTATIFGRKARLPGYNRRLHRAFAYLVCMLIGVISFTLIGSLGLVPSEVVFSVYAIALVLFLVAFGFLYIYHAPTPTSFQVQIVGLSLLTVLAVLGLVNRAFTSSGLLQADAAVTLEEETAILIEPNPTQGGYAAQDVPFVWDADYGRRLALDNGVETILPLDTPFPFAGHMWDTLHVHRNGVIAFGQSYRPILLDAFYSPTPKIAPLHIALREGYEGGVYAKQDSGIVTLTWQRMRQPDGVHEATFQLVLFAEGTFTFRYAALDVEIVSGMRGVYTGGALPRWNALLPTLSEQGTTAVLVQDLTHQYRRRVHERMLPLLYSLLGASLFIIVVFPPIFRSSLVRPVTRLLAGVQNVNQGRLDVTLPVATRDEIGQLTEHFNQMTASLRQADEDVRSYAEHLEEMVQERTAQIAEQNDQLAEQAQRLQALDEAKSKFFANISHEFRTPLTLILGPLQRAQAEAKALSLDDQEMMQRNALRLQRLINQILDLARLEAGSLSLNHHVDDLYTFARRQALLFQAEATYREIELDVEDPTGACSVAIDAEHMEKVIANLLSNALKFTPAGGRIRVSCGVTVVAEKRYADLIVADTGCGIPEDALPHVFDRFYQVDDTATRLQEGSGIGLALVKEVVELHGGSVAVTSTVGRGTTFTVRLPLAMEVAEERVVVSSPELRPVTSRAPAAPRTEKIVHKEADQTTVLVVEDNPDMRAFITSILARDFRIIEAADGQEGLAHAQEHLPDLILTDVMMPHMDGLTFSRALKAQTDTDTIPLIVLTARASADDAVEGLMTGADAYLTKPFHAEALRLQVHNVIRRQHRLRERLLATPVPAGSDVPSRSPFEEQVRAIITERLADPLLSVEDVAEALDMDRFQLLSQLQEAASLKPRQLIMTMRMDAAATLLQERAGNVSEVAYAVGFNSLAYFSRRFRSHFGISPSKFGA